MKLAVVAAVGSYTPEDLDHKKRSLCTVLRPDTHLDMFVADSGVPYVESSLELYLSEVAVARKVVEVAGMGYDAVVGTAFLDNGLDAAQLISRDVCTFINTSSFSTHFCVGSIFDFFDNYGRYSCQFLEARLLNIINRARLKCA